MTTTFLSHTDCGGNIVLDATKRAKLVAPSFAINTNGISSLTFDIQVVEGGVLEPSFMCTTCNLVVENDAIPLALSARCQICGELLHVESLFVHTNISCLCQSCKTKLDSFVAENRECDVIIRDYVELFGITKRLKVIPLYKVLTSPITI